MAEGGDFDKLVGASRGTDGNTTERWSHRTCHRVNAGKRTVRRTATGGGCARLVTLWHALAGGGGVLVRRAWGRGVDQFGGRSAKTAGPARAARGEGGPGPGERKRGGSCGYGWAEGLPCRERQGGPTQVGFKTFSIYFLG